MKSGSKMNRKILLFALLFLFFASSSVFAKRDITKRDVEKMDSWQEEFDLASKKSGKYNIIVTAKDKGGNVAYGGPYNIYIDPESDRPVTGITNPQPNMRVPGNLNIVGTCIDDDNDGKPKRVWLIFDGDEEHKVMANGTQFWSYYLDTTELAEGPHTIEAYGEDYQVDEGKKEAIGKRVKVVWNLDRRQPVTSVTNHGIGELVSGKVDLKGTVHDGNGIDSLAYSVDGGDEFESVKLKYDKKEAIWKFELPVDTRKFPDGPAVIWFKAVDKMGSSSVYSYLYFIDNTKPDVKIVSPAEGEVSNGIFGVAGYAKDKIGLSKLSWKVGDSTGDFELIPGNPYFYKELDTRNMSGKSVSIEITALDTLGNSVTIRKELPLNQELDKPTVKIDFPSSGEALDGEANSYYLGGLASDDDGVSSVAYKVDGGEEKTVETHGSFYVPLSDTYLKYGKHVVSVYATDIHGIKGNPVSVEFVSKGKAPVFETDVMYGQKFHPEDNPHFDLKVKADAALESVKYVVSGGENFSFEQSVDVAPESRSVPVSIPLSDAPWGMTQLKVFATDVYGRTSVFRSLVNIKNLTRIETDSPKVVFDDTRILPGNDGNSVIVNDKNNPVTGYFLNSTDVGNIKSVALVPDTRFATVEFKKNVIYLKAAAADGDSAPVVVRVTTDQNKTFDSQPIVFRSKMEVDVPSLHLDESLQVFDVEKIVREAVESARAEADAKYEADVAALRAEDPEAEVPAKPELVVPPQSLKFNGKITSLAAVKSLGYRIYSFGCGYDAAAGNKMSKLPDNASVGDFVNLPLPSGRTAEKEFSFEIPCSSFGDGISVVEVVVDNGEKATDAFFVTNVKRVGKDAKGKNVSADAPQTRWVDAEEIYYASAFQGGNEISGGFGRFSRSEINTAVKKFTASVSYGAKQPAVSNHDVKAVSDAKVFIRKIGDFEFANGMFFVMSKDATGIPVEVEIESKIPVKSISFKVEGEKAPGGEESASGNDIPVSLLSENRYTAQFTIGKQPSRLSVITVNALTDLGTATCRGTVSIVRDMDSSKISDSAKVYWNPSNAEYAASDNQWILSDSFEFEGFANVYGPVTVSLAGSTAGVSVVTGDYIAPVTELENANGAPIDAKAPNVAGNPRKIILKFEKDGLYRNVSVKVKDSIGNEYVSAPVTILVDNEAPAVKITSPSYQQWIQNSAKLSAEASDVNGIVKSEYSLDNGNTWTAFRADGSQTNLALDSAPEGLDVIYVRATDKSGKTTVESVGVQKDVTPPEVSVVIPAPEDVINGENTIAFIAKDNGNLVKSEYSFKDAKTEVEISPMVNTHVGTADKPLDQEMAFTFTDEAGNSTKIDKWDFVVDQQSDLPIASIDLPEEDAVLTRDFNISGTVLDDDGKSKISWKIDDGAYQELPEYDNSFSIDIPIKSMTDNEHSVTVFAVDINGVKGQEVTREFRISLEEPKGQLLTPPITETVRNTITLTGEATDENGIKMVYVSLDNGNSYDEAIGNYSHEEKKCNWSYEFDTRVIEDGTHVVFIKIVDWYGIEGLYSSLINIDNTAPEIELELPLDDSVSTGNLFFSGQTIDNIKLTELFITVRSLDGKRVPANLAKTDLTPDEIITQVLNISSLEDGFYNIELTGKDAADNITRVSRNIRLDKTSPVAKVDLLYPLNGEHVQSVFNIYGTATCAAERKISTLKLYSDGAEIAETVLSDSGYYKFRVNNELMAEGQHRIKVVATLDNGQSIVSNEQYLIYNPIGPWITIDNFTYGDFAVDRPYIRGKAGYVVSEEEKELAKDKSVSKRKHKKRVAELEAKSIDSIQLSLDNGMTWETLSEKSDWKYRVENEDIAEGFHFLLVRAKMKNGEVAVTRCIVQVDSTKPTVKLISPGVGGRYNQTLDFSGLSHDDIELKSVELALRKGDKASYEIPGFIQGLYFDAQFWGATLFSVGAGLSFFDDNVKLQFQFGQFTQAQRDIFTKSNLRYGGNVMGVKLLANVLYVPFRYYFGPDWEWLSLNLSLGANFSHFSESGSGTDQILSAMLVQLEFPKVTRDRHATRFRTFSMYTEGQFWFIPSDVSSADIPTLVPQISLGLRAYVF